MFRIEDGREQFYQWDIDRKLIVEDSTITEVHFCNRTGDCSLVCETYTENGTTLVNVPNILLQTDWRIRVYAYIGYTKHEQCFDVIGRTKPSDYAYHEVELKELVGKQIRNENGEIVGEIFNDFVENNATGGYAHAEGKTSIASGWCSHAEGAGGIASGKYSHAQNMTTIAEGNQSHAEGWSSLAQGVASHAEGYKTQALGLRSHSEGANTIAQGEHSHAEGYKCQAIGKESHAEGEQTIAQGTKSHAEGYLTQANGYVSHAQGIATIAQGEAQTVIGKYNVVDEDKAFIIGNGKADDKRSTCFFIDWDGNANFSGNVSTTGKGQLASLKEVQEADTVLGNRISSLNNQVNSFHNYVKPGQAETALLIGYVDKNKASGKYSIAEGCRTIASGKYQHALGKYNVEDAADEYAVIVGNGLGDTDRRNAHTIDWNGNGWYKGYVEASSIILQSADKTRWRIKVTNSGELKAEKV